MSYLAKARAGAAARLAAIRAAETSDKRAGDGVEEDYGNDAAGPSSSAKFKRGGVVADVDGDMPKARMDRAARSSKAIKRAMGGAVTDQDVANYRRSMGLKSDEDAAAMDEAVRQMRNRAMGAGAEASGRSNYGQAQGYKYGGKAKGKPEMKAKPAEKPKRAYGGPVMGDHDEPDGDEAPGPGAGLVEGEGKAKDKAADKAKGKTIVNVIVAPQAAPSAAGQASGPPMVPPPAVARPAPPQPMPAANPMPIAPGLTPTPTPMPGGMPMRKHGGRVMHGGAGGAEGRIEKSGIKDKVRP